MRRTLPRAGVGGQRRRCRRDRAGASEPCGRPLVAAGAQPWTQLPCWVPETGEDAGVFEGDTRKALAAGLVVRPVEETVADTWAWVQEAGVPKGRPGMEPGLPEELERALLQ